MSKNTIDLRAAPRDESGRVLPALFASNDTSRDANGYETSRKLPTFYRDYEREIYLFVATENRAVTRQEICKAVGLKKTAWFIAKIERLVEEGFLRRVHGTWRNGALVFLYEVAQ